MKYLKTILLVLCCSYAIVAASRPKGDSIIVKLSPDGEGYMTCFFAPRPNGQAVVITPGGGYKQTSLNKYYSWARFFNRLGVSVFAVKYRMPEGERRRPLRDATAALQTIHDNAKAWQIDADKIGVMGTSAGGHLAAMMATRSEKALRPAFQILLSPVITMGREGCHRGSVDRFLGRDTVSTVLREQYSAEMMVDRHTPPALIFTCNDDLSVPVATNTLAYYHAMLAAKRPVSLHLYPTGGHTGTNNPSFPYRSCMEAEIEVWLKSL